MGAILLADHSPHARRMGERMLRDEGYTVECVADGTAALERLSSTGREAGPDLVIADAFLPGCGGFELCRQAKARGRHVRVILTGGLLEEFDEDEARRAGSDAVIRKPFEATAFLELVRQQMRAAQMARVQPEDREWIAAEVARQVQEALPGVVREITEKVLGALGNHALRNNK